MRGPRVSEPEPCLVRAAYLTVRNVASAHPSAAPVFTRLHPFTTSPTWRRWFGESTPTMRASTRASARRFAYALATAARQVSTAEAGTAARASVAGEVGDSAPDGAGDSAPDGAGDSAPDGAGDSAPDGAGDSAPDGAVNSTSSGGSATTRPFSERDESTLVLTDGDGRASRTGTPITSAIDGVRVRQTHHPNSTPTASAATAATAHSARDGDGPDAGAPHHLHAPMLRG